MCFQALKTALHPHHCCLNFQNKLNIKNITKGLIYILSVMKSSSLLPVMKGILLSDNKLLLLYTSSGIVYSRDIHSKLVSIGNCNSIPHEFGLISMFKKV